jgi:hypothetical protein
VDPTVFGNRKIYDLWRIFKQLLFVEKEIAGSMKIDVIADAIFYFVNRFQLVKIII